MTETKSLGKGAGLVAWFQWLRAVATPSGASASFTIGDVRLIGSSPEQRPSGEARWPNDSNPAEAW
jgi:hypothetical protein